MKKYIIGLFSIFILFASILGAPSKSPKGQPSSRSDRGSGLWV